MSLSEMFTAADVSVVIPAYNCLGTIEACLQSIMVQDAQPSEVIVVDSSQDDTPNVIAGRFPMVHLYHTDRRIFPGPARNIGAGVSSGNILAFLDSDCVASTDWVRRMVAHHNDGHLVVGGAVEVGNPSSSLAWVGHLAEFREFLPLGEARHVPHVPTCNISYRTTLFEKWGGFPNAFYPQEDLLYNYMLNQRGIWVWFDPAIRVRHFCRESLRGYLSHQHSIGRVTRCTLRRIDLPGSSIARHARLARLASPALGLAKYVRTVAAFLQFPRQVLQYPSVLAITALGSIWWARGFSAGASTGLSGIHGWADPDEPIFAMLNELKRKTS